MTYIPISKLRDPHLGQLNLQAERDFPRALFVCSGGMLRSATCAQVMAHYGWNTRAAGTYDSAIQKITPTTMKWADLIFCMEQTHVRQIKMEFPEVFEQVKTHIRIMNLSDIYFFRKDRLIHLILKYFGIEETQETVLKLFEEPKHQAKEMLAKLILEENGL